MKAVFRNLISVLLVFEMLISSVVSGGPVKLKQTPDGNGGEYGKYVDPFAGTGGIPWACAMLSPAATAPFGCVRLGPDTSAVNGITLVKTNTSGYYYGHRHILGFSYGRLSGTGIRDLGMFRVTPFIGGEKKKPPKSLAFSHNSETASPGYYAVYLPGAAALAEMTATSHTGYQRYTFKTKKNASLYLNAASVINSGSTKEAVIKVDPESKTLTGSVVILGGFSERYGGLKCYYYAEFDRPLRSFAYSSEGSAVRLDFGDLYEKSVTLRAGISFVSAENAEENLSAEAGELDFDDVREKTAEEWETRLSKIKINADEEIKKIFYTAFYHTMIMPTDFTDADGSYLGFEKEIHKAEGFKYRTDMSLWDTARNVHSLYMLTEPEIQNDCLQSLLLMADMGGTLPRWPSGAGYTGSMFGNPANLVFAESYLKNIGGVDYKKALDGMIKTAEKFDNIENREYGDLYNKYGYVPDDLVRDQSSGYSVSRTLEYSWEDSAAAVLADKLGESETARIFSARSENYKNIWDDETKYFRGRNSDGTFGVLKPNLTDFYDDIFGWSYSAAYCEGSARHWRWGALQDIDGMINLFGSKEYFVDELLKFMKDASKNRAAVDPGSGYWIGNQHDLHTPYLFSNAGRADLTQKWVRWTLKNRFADDIDGLDGNDDGGTLSAWYVFSAMGFYPLAGSDRYWLGSPCINDGEISLPNGKVLKITAENQSENNIYVEKITLNGKDIDGPYISHGDIIDGGTLVFTMTDKAK
ncbi:MAG: GH92 family glycosyl hydrolase [Clostridiales bacterium]|nr:GH92 family glycosyl hydrolase [Clostridiales bacterium]